MAIQCNIDRRGRAARVIPGILVAAAGATLAASDVPFALFALALAMIATGGFMLFEGAVGWCVVRHFGGDTPL